MEEREEEHANSGHVGFILPLPPVPRGQMVRLSDDWSLWTPDTAKHISEAERRRRDLSEFGDRFRIQVSNDVRSAAQCLKCLTLLVGDREDAEVLRKQLLNHSC